MDWFRWWHGTVNDPKFGWVAKKAACNVGEVIAVWACLMERASSVTQCDAGIERGDMSGFSCDDYDIELGYPDGRCAQILAAFVDRGLIIEGRFTQWEKRQPKREDSSAERTRDYRERQKQNAISLGDGYVTQGDAPEEIRVEKKRRRTKAVSTEKVVGDAVDSSSRGTRLPRGKDWKLPKEWGIESHKAYNPPKGFIVEEAAKFRDHWIAQPGMKGRKTDWEATWRNWMRKANADRLIAEKRMQGSVRGGDVQAVSDHNAGVLEQVRQSRQQTAETETTMP